MHVADFKGNVATEAWINMSITIMDLDACSGDIPFGLYKPLISIRDGNDLFCHAQYEFSRCQEVAFAGNIYFFVFGFGI